MISDKKIVIAIDGFSSCGKSTVAKSLAKKLNYIYIDSGAMYRAVTLFALRNNLIVNGEPDKSKVIDSLKDISISFKFDKNTEKNTTFMNGENIEEEIRKLEVSNNVSPNQHNKRGAKKRWLSSSVKWANKKGLLWMEGILDRWFSQNAELKIFMTASPEIRAQRRYDELLEKGQKVSIEEIIKNINERDFIDQNRKESPLVKPKDAIVLDNSNFTLEETVGMGNG